MTKSEVLERLCGLIGRVNEEVFKDDNLAHDCFCIDGQVSNFSFDEKLIDYIETAVELSLS